MIPFIMNYIISSYQNSQKSILFLIINCFNKKKFEKYNINEDQYTVTNNSSQCSVNRCMISNSFKVKLRSNQKYKDNIKYLSINLINKKCCYKKCNKNLGLYIDWYCYNGNIYCTTECRMYSIYDEQNCRQDIDGLSKRRRLYDSHFYRNYQLYGDYLGIANGCE